MFVKSSGTLIRSAWMVAAAVGLSAAGTARAGFMDPSFFGQPGTTTQTWTSFTNPSGPNAPTSASNPFGTANAFDTTAATDGVFLIPDPDGMHMYSFSGVLHPEVDVPGANLGALYRTEVVLQVQVLGNPLDANSFALAAGPNGAAISPMSLSMVNAGGAGAFPGSDFFYTVTWDVSGSASNSRLTFTPGQPDSSQVAYRVDTLTTLAPTAAVPEPASLTALSLGLLGTTCGLAAARHLSRRGAPKR
jgi:hypothetical protein